MNLTDTIKISSLPRLGKVPLCSTFPKTWKHRAPVFTLSSNIAKFGLSTGYIKYEGNNMLSPIGIYLNNDADEPFPASQDMTYTLDNTINPPIQIFPNTASKFSVNNNHISKGAESDITKPIIGIIGGTIDDAINNSFVNLNKGITLNVPIVNVQRNKFINNIIGLEMKPMLPNQSMGSQRTNFNCNYFETDNAITRTGIEINPGTQQFQFGFYQNDDVYSLGGNVWPTASTVNRSIASSQDVNLDWASPSNWNSIKNNSSTNLNYFRFNNEFVGNTSSLVNIQRAQSLGSPFKAFTNANNNVPSGNANYVQVCDGSLSATTVFFPTPLIFNSDNPIGGKLPEVQIYFEGNSYTVKATSDYIQTLYMTDITGRILFKEMDVKKTSIELPTSGLATGTYLIHTITTSGKRSTSKLITK